MIMLLLPITDQDHRITLTDHKTLGLKKNTGGFISVMDRSCQFSNPSPAAWSTKVFTKSRPTC